MPTEPDYFLHNSKPALEELSVDLTCALWGRSSTYEKAQLHLVNLYGFQDPPRVSRGPQPSD